MTPYQAGILQPIPAHAIYLVFDVRVGSSPDSVSRVLSALANLSDGQQLVIGLGARLVGLLDKHIDGLTEFQGVADSRVRLPATPAALFCWLRQQERGALVRQLQQVLHAVTPVFEVQSQVDAFKYLEGRDLSGYEDGTENPEAEAAIDTAFVSGDVAGLAGSSFVAVQQWTHRFERFDAMTKQAQDDAIGRRQSDNEELDDAPESAHVKRTAQEDFTPEAFMLRRSMPWSGADKAGLMFAAFGKSFYAFEAQLRRMSGAEDGIVDALFQFTQPQTGSYFWCPPMHEGKLDLRLLGVA
ncbi:Dyp-type peroxidase [Undibacterium sp. TS12]|uniref:Dyp-type peroxidase n=1 Tax=Undibacterium sp. TS12 TaxID=2908202 RepID=UPI001F4CE7AB|nr:Dyp-type peroxidase [Undibacterium sp. TS12]MCH8621478.1 Dyp-type peroxidase [Undibacterium sp. TS12]